MHAMKSPTLLGEERARGGLLALGGAIAQQLRDRLVFDLEEHPVANRQHLLRMNVSMRERILVELMTLDRQLKASREGSK